MQRVILGLLISILFWGCSADKTPIGPADQAGISIYLLKDPSILITQITDVDLNDLALANSPLISTNDIDYYDYSTHCIYLKQNKSNFFPQDFSDQWYDRPFVVCAGFERCYVGRLIGLGSSLRLAYPTISHLDVYYYPDDVLHISKESGIDQEPRKNEIIEKALKQTGLYHAGLSIILSDFQVINNSDTATVRYSYQLMNNDQYALYVLDPDKMGSAKFHYFTNGPDFWGNDGYNYSEYKIVDAPENLGDWQPEWFTRLAGGMVMQRTVELKGYHHFNSGHYTASFKFNSPKPIDKTARERVDGRYWLGTIESNTINRDVY